MISVYHETTNSASNKNEYQEWFLGDKGGWCVGLTTLLSPCAECLEICDPQPSGNLRVSQGLYRDGFTLLYNYSNWNTASVFLLDIISRVKSRYP
jgi:hypothetical protein